MSRLLELKINNAQQTLINNGLLRRRVCQSPKDVSLNFSSNDYLGLAHEPMLAEALHQGALRFGVGSGASPLVSGYSEAHVALEQHLCALTGHEAALLFSSGFSANSALMKSLFDGQDLVLADKLVHASVIDGLRDSGAQLKRFLHNSVESATRLFTQATSTPVSALITESVFSMDGDVAPLAELSHLCREQGAWLIVDDAHGFGCIGHQGAGATRLDGLAANAIDAQVVTFGKALGCQGAVILGSQLLIDYLVSHSREYIYSTALSPANAYLALKASEFMLAHADRLAQLQHNISQFRGLALAENLPLLPSSTAIQPIIIGDAAKTLAVAQQLRSLGIQVGAIRPPTVPVGSARLRLTLSARHTADEIQFCVASLAKVLTEMGIPRCTVRDDEQHR